MSAATFAGFAALAATVQTYYVIESLDAARQATFDQQLTLRCTDALALAFPFRENLQIYVEDWLRASKSDNPQLADWTLGYHRGRVIDDSVRLDTQLLNLAVLVGLRIDDLYTIADVEQFMGNSDQANQLARFWESVQEWTYFVDDINVGEITVEGFEEGLNEFEVDFQGFRLWCGELMRGRREGL